MTHKSDCAVNNMPALPAGPCDCGYLVTVRREDLREVFWRDINPEMPFKVAEGEVAARLTAMEDAANGAGNVREGAGAVGGSGRDRAVEDAS